MKKEVFIVKYSEIPKELRKLISTLDGSGFNVFLGVHIPEDKDIWDDLDEWLSKKYPGIEKEDIFFIHLDQFDLKIVV